MFLKEIKKEHFLKNPQFSGFVFFMELLLNDGRYLTIKRSVEKNTSISLKLHNERNQDFRETVLLDHLSLPLTSKDQSKNPVHLLNMYLNFEVLPGESYRKTTGYFFRSQRDYDDVFKLSKHRGSDIDWKPILFELLGFNKQIMEKKYLLEESKEKKEEQIVQYKSDNKIDESESDRIKGFIEIKEKES